MSDDRLVIENDKNLDAAYREMLATEGEDEELEPFDALNHMLAMQAEFNAKLGHVVSQTSEDRSYWLFRYLHAISMETAEAIDWLPWKWWSKRSGNKEVTPEEMWSDDHIEELKTELIDIQHFLNCCYLELGMGHTEVLERYKHKMGINIARSDTPTY